MRQAPAGIPGSAPSRAADPAARQETAQRRRSLGRSPRAARRKAPGCTAHFDAETAHTSGRTGHGPAHSPPPDTPRDPLQTPPPPLPCERDLAGWTRRPGEPVMLDHVPSRARHKRAAQPAAPRSRDEAAAQSTAPRQTQHGRERSLPRARKSVKVGTASGHRTGGGAGPNQARGDPTTFPRARVKGAGCSEVCIYCLPRWNRPLFPRRVWCHNRRCRTPSRR